MAKEPTRTKVRTEEQRVHEEAADEVRPVALPRIDEDLVVRRPMVCVEALNAAIGIILRECSDEAKKHIAGINDALVEAFPLVVETPEMATD